LYGDVAIGDMAQEYRTMPFPAVFCRTGSFGTAI
jgi:hypothetical protein